MSKKTEKIVDLLINEEHNEANTALRELMVEMSRKIYNEGRGEKDLGNDLWSGVIHRMKKSFNANVKFEDTRSDDLSSATVTFQKPVAKGEMEEYLQGLGFKGNMGKFTKEKVKVEMTKTDNNNVSELKVQEG